MDGLDEVVAEFLKPIRDLSKNFELDIEECLNKFCISIHYDGQVRTFNFSQAAMVLQGASHVYAKKVDHLYDTSQAFFTRLDSLIRSKKILPENADDAHESTSGSERFRKRLEDDFGVLPEFERGKDIHLKDSVSSKPYLDYIVTTPLALLESHGNVHKYKAPIFTLIGDQCELIGYDEDFRVNRPISMQGMLCESIFDPAFDVPFYSEDDDDIHDYASFYADELNEKDLLDKTCEEASLNIDTQSSIFMSPESLHDFPACDIEPEHEVKVQKKERKEKLQKKDIFNSDETPEFAIPRRPIRKVRLKQSWAFLNNKEPDFKGRRSKKPLSSSEFYTECKKALPSVVGPSSSFSVPALELKEVKAPLQSEGNVNDESESDEQLGLPEPEDGDDSAVTVGVDAHEMLFPAVSPPASPPAPPHLPDLNPDPSTEDAPYDVIVQKRLSEVVAASKDYFEMSDLEARVRKWQEYLRPKLEEEARRPSFNLQDCLTFVLNQFSGQNVQTLGVHAVMQGLAERDISRMFLAMLMLANKGVVMLSERKTGNQRVNEIDVSLTSTDIHALFANTLHMDLTELTSTESDDPPPKKRKKVK